MRGGVEVADVVALDLETGAIFGAGIENVGDVTEGVAEDPIVTFFQVRPLPVVLEVGKAVEHFVQAEVHRAHVQRGQFRLELHHWLQAFFHAHGRRAAGGDVDHHVAGGLDLRQELGEQRRVLAGATVVGVTGMQVHNRGAGFGGTDGGVGNFLGGDRQMR